ncbi:MAG: hypothetical protein ACXW2E_07365 [Nitrososphaeraceae archaeon]
MIFWIRIKDSANDKKKYIRIEDEWHNYFYLASNDISKLKEIIQNDGILSSIISHEFVKRFEKITDTKKIVLKLFTAGRNLKLTNTIEKMIEYHDFRLYNVDQLPEQQYFFDHDIFPLGFFRINNNTPGLD